MMARKRPFPADAGQHHQQQDFSRSTRPRHDSSSVEYNPLAPGLNENGGGGGAYGAPRGGGGAGGWGNAPSAYPYGGAALSGGLPSYGGVGAPSTSYGALPATTTYTTQQLLNALGTAQSQLQSQLAAQAQHTQLPQMPQQPPLPPPIARPKLQPVTIPTQQTPAYAMQPGGYAFAQQPLPPQQPSIQTLYAPTATATTAPYAQPYVNVGAALSALQKFAYPTAGALAPTTPTPMQQYQPTGIPQQYNIYTGQRQ